MKEYLPAIKGSTACPVCGCGSHDTMSMDAILAVGFGDVNVTCDDKCVYSETVVENEQFWTGQDADDAANKDPDHDWRVHFYAPLFEAHFQRQGERHWPLVKKGEGFA